ncbi:hypothetical protein [Billgrantia antri]|uniref:hypothetical protein n=1 Tax=Billgrantia antri TaxID=2846777 RepID=UPI003B220A78
MTTANSPQEPRPYHDDDEISLVDLAKILIQRWKAMLIVFTVVVLGASAYAWKSRPEVGEPRTAYTTLLSVGFKTPTVLIEPLRAVATQLEDAFIPAALQALDTSIAVSVDFNERDTNVIRLKTTVSGNNTAEQIREVHQQALAPLVERHQNILEALAHQEEGTSRLIPPTEARLLVPTEVTSLAQRSKLPNEPSGTSPKLVIALGVVLGGMLAIMAAFMLHFASLVRESMKEEQAKK